MTPPTILAIDDERDITELLRIHFERAGYSVATASSGREALEFVRWKAPDLIVLDLMLPDIDGFAICEILRSNPATAKIPVVVLSAWTKTDTRNWAFDLGAMDFLTKPFSPRELLAKVGRLISLPARKRHAVH